MYKRKHRLINFLSWLLICTQILTSAGLATVGALQPTPEMAQAIAQEASFGDWLAARAGDLAAWAQPLWGEPKTAAAQTAAPGGVSSGLTIWHKADKDVAVSGTSVTSWKNEATANLATLNGATSPTYVTTDHTNFNFNPYIQTTATTNGLSNLVDRVWSTGGGSTANGTAFFATKNLNANSSAQFFCTINTAQTGNERFNFVNFDYHGIFTGTPLDSLAAYSTAQNGLPTSIQQYTFNGGAATGVRNRLSANFYSSSSYILGDLGYVFGSDLNITGGLDQAALGLFGEIITFDRALTANEAQKINSYLAIKYGITLGGAGGAVSYLNSTSTSSTTGVVWTGNSAYQNHVIGIGRDDASELEQQIAASMESTSDIITIATDNNFTGANGTHTAIANDLSYFLVGNNGGSTSYTAKTGLSNGLNAILNRVWKVEQTGTAQDLYLKTSNSQATYLLYSTDATFSTGVTYAALTSGATAGLQIPNGNYFTFATTTAPPVLQSLTSTTADGAYTNGDQIAICANYDQELAAGSTLNVTLDTGATLTLTHVDASLGGTISVDGSYAIGTGANNVVHALALQSDEKAVIGGQFTTYNGTTRTRIARINSDGTLDTSFDPGTGLNNYPEAILMQPDGKILIAGNFTTVNGTSRTYLARLNSDGSLDTSFNTTLNNVVYAMALQADGKIVIGGQFSTVNGTGRTRIARVNSDGTLDTSFTPGTGLNNYPEALLVRPDGKVLIAGNFTTVNGTSRAYLGLLNSDGTLDTSFTPTLNNVVYAMTRQSDGKLVISGAFSTVNSTGRTRLARLNADGTLDSGFDPGTGLNNYAESIIVQSDNKLLLGGNFTTVNGTSRAYLARVNADGAVDTTFAPGTGANNVVYALGLQSDGKVVSGGAFTSFNGTSQNRLTRLNGDANNAASADQQACGTYTVLPGHNSNDLTVSAITSANVIATTGDTSTATTIPSGENLADNAALVIASSAPGGVTTNLAWWFQGNRGVQTSGTAVTQWNDSNVALNVSQATAANQPTVSKSQNFNPIVTFDGSNDYLSNSAGYWKATTSNNQYDTFVVSTNQNTGGVNAVFGESTSAGTQMMFLPYSGNAYNGFWNSYTSSNNQIGTTGTPYLWSGRFNNSSTPKVNAISQNGKQLASSTSTAAFNGSSSALYLGAHQPNNWYYNGDVAEVALYASDLSATQRQQVLSYLALKWGLTLDQTTATDYLASDGTTQMWSSSANSGYANNIAGIGRDLNAGLNQKQSQSVNSGTQVVIGLGTIAASNAANANSFAADKSFLTWGDNGQATTFGVSYSPTSFTPVAGYYRMSRVWKVQESGTITDVVVFTGKGEHLLVSNDPTFATGVTEIALTSGSATVDLSNGQYFTFGNTLYAPGGVTANLAAWYKADGTVGATQWDDASGNDKHMLAAGDGTAARMPTLDATPGSANNFNPRVAFLSNADANRKWTMTAAGNNVFATTTTPGTIFNVASFPDETVYDVPQMYAFEDDDPGFNLVTDRNTANDIRVIFQRDNGGTGSAGWDFVVPGVSQTQSLLTAHAWNYAAGGNTFTFNGYDYTPSTNSFIGATSPRYIFGAELTSGGGEAHSGYTSENIVYAVAWPANSNERKRINSYLAIKYGITLLGTGTLAGGAADATFGGTADYLDSASTIIWSGTTTNSSYHNNVAGIGRDDASALNQKQSTSVNSGFQPVIGLGTIAASNAANSNTFTANKSYLVWGDNNGTTTFGVSYSPTSFTPVAGYYRMNRVWKVQETGTITNVVVQVSKGEHLLVSSDPTFATGVTEIALTSGSATVDLSNGQYFTFGNTLYAPGGVATNLNRWYKANVGVTTATGVAQWADQSQNEVSVTQATAANQPVYNTASNLLNFNPSLTFDGSNDRLNNTTGGVALGTGGYTAFYVASNTTPSASQYALGFGAAGALNGFNSGTAATATSKTSGGTTFATQTTAWTAGIANLTRTGFTGGANQPYYLASNGGAEATSTNVSPNVTDLNLAIGARPDGAANFWQGNIAEVVLYSGKQTATDYNKVESYLALKYGLTKAGNYVDTAATTVWTSGGGYDNKIIGLARDDVEGLNQQIATSQDATGDLLTISTDSNFTNTNGLHTALASDLAYLVIGNNNGAATYATTNVAAGYHRRITRQWLAQNSNFAQNVYLKFTGYGSDAEITYYLVKRNGNSDLTTGITQVTALDADGVTASPVTLASGDYFTVMGSGLDSDGDNVANIDDLDDDNDGILDTAEGYQCTFAGAWSNAIAWDVEHDISTSNVGTYFVDRPATTQYPATGSAGWDWLFPSGSPASNGGISWAIAPWSNNGTIADAFAQGHYVYQEFTVSSTADLQAGAFSQWAGGHTWQMAILISTDPTFATYDQVYNGPKPTSGWTTLTNFDHPIILNAGVTYYIRSVFLGTFASSSAWDTLYMWYDPADGNATNCGSALDTDNDGIVNQLDLDSDGDACPDATEGGTHFTSLSASSLPGGNSGVGYTGPSSTPVTENLGNTVASNGVPTVAGSGQSAAGSASVLANSCYAPGGVNSNLARWYRADQSVTTATGAASWVDYMNAVELTQGTATNQPVYNTASNLLNYNPSLTFDGANDRLNNTSGGVAFGTGGYTAYYVASNTTPSASKYVLGFGVSGNLNGFNTGAASTATSKTSGGTTFVTETNAWTAAIANLTRTGFTGGATQPYYLASNGGAETTSSNVSPNVTDLNFAIGARPDGTNNFWQGNIAEVILYSGKQTATDYNKVESYLALKYGITKAGNYVNTVAATVWDATANSGYTTNIAGIGRDDLEALHQKQSQSINSGTQVAIGLGTIAASNAANPNSFAADKSFLTWGDNGQATTFGVSYSPTSFTPVAGYYRMNRIWKVQETGTITNVVVQASQGDHLLVSSDPTFATGVTEIALTSGSATVDFSNGQYFTFGQELTAPGGVASGLTSWYRANTGITTATGVSQWNDQSGNSRNATQATGASQPGFTAVGLNFNPILTFNGSSQYLSGVDTAMATGTASRSMIGVAINGVADGSWRYIFTHGTAGGGLTSGFGKSSTNFGSTHGWASDFVSTNPWTPINTPHLQYGDYNGTNARSAMDGGAITGVARSWNTTLNGFVRIGSNPSGGELWNGSIAEVVTYNGVLSAADLLRVNSYLAIKYGITLDQSTAQNYVAADGSVLWDATANSTYKNNIAGIGRDDASVLQQKQSKSINSGFQPTIGLGAIAASNAANSNTFSANKSFLMWGDNNQAASYAVTYNPTTFTPAGGYYRMNRVWKVQETGTITNVVVLASSAEHLLVSSDPTFATGVTEIAMSSGSATVDFTDGQYFTFGTAQIAPGGVSADLAFWYKPDAGVTLSSDKVSSWVDQVNGIELTPAAANNGPTYYDSGPDLMNFNPVLNFTNVTRQDSLRTATGLPAIPNGVSTFSVLLPDDASNRWFLHWGVANFGYYNNYGTCNANNPGAYTNSHGGCVNSPTTLGPITTPAFLSVRWNTTAGTNQWQLRRNGQLHSGTTSSTVLNVPADTALEIGDVNNRTAGNEYVGNISEVIGYTARLGDTDRQKIESYLSIKYGITYMNDANTAATNYLNSAGTTIWDATANSSYASNIAGIGRDDASALHQKQSQSVNSGFQPTIGLGTIATSNAANSSTFVASKSFLLWGDNNGALTLSAAYNGSANARLARVWKVQESGTVGAVQVRLPRSILSTAALRTLIVHSSDPNFGTVDRTIPLSSSGGNYVATVDFNNGDFFTFSSISTLPEIDVTPTTIDFGTVNSGSTAPAQAVTIQNQGDVSLNISSIALSGADAARFAISSNNCGASLSAGASCTVQITFSPTASGSRSALLVITNNDSDESTVNVVLSGATPSSIGGGDTDTYNLAVTKSASVSNATVGTPFTYTITVLNKGTTAASNVVMTDQLPAGVAFGSVNATGGGNCTENSSVVTCTWAALAGGATATVTITVTP